MKALKTGSDIALSGEDKDETDQSSKRESSHKISAEDFFHSSENQGKNLISAGWFAFLRVQIFT